MNTPSLKEVSWADVADNVKAVNPNLYDIICEIDPGKKFRLYLAKLPYGTKTLRGGKFYIPNKENQMTALSHQTVKQRIKDDLSYNVFSHPAALVLDKSFEIFLDKPISDEPVVLATVRPGSFIGLSKILAKQQHQPAFVWDITSGSRSAFMLPKITQKRKIKRLRTELGINIEPPESKVDHWNIFAKIANCEYGTDWHSSILYFSKSWFEKLEDTAWKKFKFYLRESTDNLLLNTGAFHIWDTVLSIILKHRDIRPSLYTNNTVRYLFQVASGLVPGFRPELSDTYLPVEHIQKVFTDIYRLETYFPVIMTANYLDIVDNTMPLYTSLILPNFLDTPKKKDASSNISETYEIKSLLDKYIYEIKNSNFNLKDTILYDYIVNYKIDAFHPNPERYTIIKNTNDIFKSDSRFSDAKYSNGTEPAIYSSFFKGCFRFNSCIQTK